VRFASFLSGGSTTMAIINPSEKKLAKRTSVHCIKSTHRKKATTRIKICKRLIYPAAKKMPLKFSLTDEFAKSVVVVCKLL